MALTPKKIEAQARACAQALATVLECTLIDRRPADLALAALQHDNPQFGARDRRLIRGSVFAAFRWWGWLRRVAPGRFRPKPDDSAWARVLLGAHLLDTGTLPEAAAVWVRQAGVEAAELAAIKPEDELVDKATRVLGCLRAEMPDDALEATELVPAWTCSRIVAPRALPEVIDWLQKRPPIWIRAQTGNIADLAENLEAAGVTACRHPRLNRAFSIASRSVNLRGVHEYRKGIFEIQDAASQIIGLICAPEPRETWWDACAGAGGKTLHLADLMSGRGAIVASDIREPALRELRRRARRAGFRNITCRDWRGSPLPDDEKVFDGVLLDAPCTCSGVWRRNPDARWRLQESELDERIAVQDRLLHSAASGVRAGGVLVYATCSMFQHENETVIERFLAADSRFELEPFPDPLTGRTVEGMLHIWPWDCDCDAMFAARLRRVY